MINRTIAILVALVFLVVPELMAAAEQTVTQTTYTVADGMYMIEVVVEADTSGVMSNTDTENIDGIVYMVETDPGTTAPTANYDMTLLNNNGIDIMGGNLANRSATLTQRASPLNYQAQPVKGPLTLTMSNNSVVNAMFTVRIWFFK